MFLARDAFEAKWFVEMGHTRGVKAIDVWEVTLDVDVDVSADLGPEKPLVEHEDDYIYCAEAIPPTRLRLIDPDALGE